MKTISTFQPLYTYSPIKWQQNKARYLTSSNKLELSKMHLCSKRDQIHFASLSHKKTHQSYRHAKKKLQLLLSPLTHLLLPRKELAYNNKWWRWVLQGPIRVKWHGNLVRMFNGGSVWSSTWEQHSNLMRMLHISSIIITFMLIFFKNKFLMLIITIH